MKRARIIYNPTSGREIFKRKLPDVLEKFEKAGYETSTHATSGVGDAVIAAKAACESLYDLVVAAGGDGTLNEVVSGLAEETFRPKLGLIPVGTTNDFARALNIPFTIEEAVDIILSGETIPLDIGKVHDKYFVNIAAGGSLTELTYEVPSKLKTVLGQLAYYIKGVEMIPSVKATYVRLKMDEEIFEGEIMMFLLSNSNSVGGFEKLAPDAYVNDGYFDLLILKKTTLLNFAMILFKTLRGDHLNDLHVIYRRVKKLEVACTDSMQLNLDGEFGGNLPADFQILESHLCVYAPKSVDRLLQELMN